MPQPAPIPALEIEARLELSDFTFDTLEALERMAPFGPGNSRPLFWSEGLKVIGGIRTVGKEENHLKLKLHDPKSGHSVETIGFGMGKEEYLHFLSDPDSSVDVAFELEINQWKGKKTLQLSLKDLRVSKNT
jgi:single-stranded-DNA-specific exonuclease